MQVKPFAAGRYDDQSIVVNNPENGKQELFSEEEYEMVRFLRENQDQTLLALLLPNIGIAKKAHIVICLRVIGKLKRLQLLDAAGISGRPLSSDTTTLDSVPRQKIELFRFRTFAAVLFAIAGKLLSWLGTFPLLFFTLIGAAAAFALFPFEAADTLLAGHHGVDYGKLLGVTYLTAFAGFNLRALLQAIFVKAAGREIRNAGFTFYFPCLSLDFDREEVSVAGRGARVQLALLGMLSPLLLAGGASALTLSGHLPVDLAFYVFSSSVGLTLLLACPFLGFDGADILHVLGTPGELRSTFAARLRDFLAVKGSAGRELLLGLLLSFGWLLAWLDSLRGYAETVGKSVSEDLYFYEDLPRWFGAGATGVLCGGLLLMPLAVFAFSFVRGIRARRRTRVVVAQDKLKESLTFEERMASLEKIPLFAYLNDQERLGLLNEMQPAYFAHGDKLVRQGEVGQEFFVLVRGKALAQFRDAKGNVYNLADLGVGDAFGEVALIDDVPRTASILSDGGCIALVLKKDGFDRFAETLGSPDRVKTMIRLTSFFRRHPLFSRLGARDQAQLIDSLNFETITLGEEVPVDDESFRVIYSGKVRVDTGDDAADTELDADDCFGYARGFSARYVAAEGTGLLSMKKEEFHSLIWEKLVERPDLFV